MARSCFYRLLVAATLCLPAVAWSADDAQHLQITAALQAGFISVPNTPTLTLLHRTDSPQRRPSDPTLIFFEGDGAPWTAFGTLPPRDPTPHQSIGLDLALSTARRSRFNVIYVARPCQFESKARLQACSQTQWTQDRYSNEQRALLLSSTTRALQFAATAKNPQPLVTLIGHSGGGLMAIRIAASFSQTGYPVAQVITLASPIDPVIWAKNHQFSALNLDSYYQDLGRVQASGLAEHYIGENDKLVTAKDVGKNIITSVPDTGHASGWLPYWNQTLLTKLMAQLRNE